MGCQSDSEYAESGVVHNLALPQLGEFTTRSIARTNEPLCVNYLAPDSPFVYGLDYEVQTDELGFTVCRAVQVAAQVCGAETTPDEAESILIQAASDDENDNVGETNDDVEQEVSVKAKKIRSVDPCNLPLPGVNVPAFVYNNVDLASLSEPDLFSYSTNVVKILFSKDELNNAIIPDDNNKTRSKKRTVLDPQRIQLLKGTIQFNLSRILVK